MAGRVARSYQGLIRDLRRHASERQIARMLRRGARIGLDVARVVVQRQGPRAHAEVAALLDRVWRARETCRCRVRWGIDVKSVHGRGALVNHDWSSFSIAATKARAKQNRRQLDLVAHLLPDESPRARIS